jgi:hypothetical protein
MSLFQLYEANKAKYKLLKPGSILIHKGLSSFKIKILSTNWESVSSEVVSMEQGDISVNLSHSYLLYNYEPCEDTLE